MAWKAPGTYITVNDNTDFENPVSEINTTVAIIGFAKKGPIGKPIEITSYNKFKSIFGKPIEGQYCEYAIKSILNAGGTILFVRVADEVLAAPAEVVIKNGKTATDGKIVFNRKTNITEASDQGFKLKNLYLGKFTNEEGNISKTLLVRSPKVGTFKLTSLMEQINKSFEEKFGFTEYSLKNSFFDKENLGEKIFNIEVSGSTYGPFVTTLDSNVNELNLPDKLLSSLDNSKVSHIALPFDNEGSEKYTSIKEKIVLNFSYSFDDGAILSKKIEFIGDTGDEPDQYYYSIENIVAALNENLSKDLYITTYKKDGKTYILFVCKKTNNFKIVEHRVEGNLTNSFFEFNNGQDPVSPAGFKAFTSAELSEFENNFEEEGQSYYYVKAKQAIQLDRNINIDIKYLDVTDTICFTANTETASTSSIKILGTDFGKDLFTKENSINVINFTGEQAVEGYEAEIINGKLSIVTKDNFNYGTINPAIPDAYDEFKFSEVSQEMICRPFSVLIGEEVAEDPMNDEDNCFFYVQGTQGVPSSSQDIINFVAKEKGEGTNNIGIRVYTTTSPIDHSKHHNIELYIDGTVKEKWEDVSYVPGTEGYFEDVINAEVENGGSEFVYVLVDKRNNEITEVELPDTITLTDNGIVYLGRPINEDSVVKASGMLEVDEYDYATGNNGIPEDDTTGLFLAQLDSENSQLANTDLFSWHILITPDNITEDVQNAAIDLCKKLKDATYIADTPFGYSKDEVIKWHNGQSEFRSTPLDTEFSAVYWPWCKVYDSTSKKFTWVMPSVIMAAQWCKVDRDYEPWYAPAGESSRGILSTVIDIEQYPNNADRQDMYVEYNRINPLIMLKNGNIVAFGEKTCKRKNSSLTKIHVKRMSDALRKSLKNSTRGYIFAPTFGENVANVRSIITSILEEYKTGGAIEAYEIICDSSNNTTETLQQDVVYATVIAVPTGCMEQIEISVDFEKSLN